MKRLILMFLVFGGTIFFSGCQEDEDEISEFTGKCMMVAPGEEGTTTELPDGRILIDKQTAEWYDEATDWRVTGKTFWVVNWLKEKEANTAQLWGTVDLFVDGDRGKWDMSWQGWQTPTEDGFKIVCNGVGKGVEGEVKGMTATWIYTMNFDFSTPDTSFFYATKGIIIE